MTPPFVLHPEAGRDIEEVWEYIAQDSIAAAGRVREDILDTIRDLARFPHQGHRRPDLTSGWIRLRVVREYLIAYAPEEKPPLVIAVVDGRRSPRIIAAMLRSREQP